MTKESNSAHRIWQIMGPAIGLISLAFAVAYAALTGAVNERLTGPLILCSTLLITAGAWLLAIGAFKDGEIEQLARSSRNVEVAVDYLELLKQHVDSLAASTVASGSAVDNPPANRPVDHAAQAHLDEERARRQDAERTLAEWRERTANHIRALERLATNPDLEATYRETANRIVADLERQIAPLGGAIVRPEPGEEYDQLVHEAVELVEDAGPAGRVVDVHSWGVFLGEVREPARVTISK